LPRKTFGIKVDSQEMAWYLWNLRGFLSNGQRWPMAFFRGNNLDVTT